MIPVPIFGKKRKKENGCFQAGMHYITTTHSEFYRQHIRTRPKISCLNDVGLGWFTTTYNRDGWIERK